MHTALLHSHSLIRYFVLIMLLAVIIASFTGWIQNRRFTKVDNKLSLYLLIFTHLQFVVGILLYFVSDVVQFSNETMKNAGIRYWTVEHVVGMLIAIALITAGRSTSKKMSVDQSKHKRLFIFNLLAAVVIVVTLLGSGRGILGISTL